MDPYLGQLALVPFNFAPVNWALCQGQLLPIASNAALYSLLGVQYGGDGYRTFGLPDLRGRVPVGAGSAPGLTPYDLGQMEGFESVMLTAQQLPSHIHTVGGYDDGFSSGTGSPAGAVPTANYNTAFYGRPQNLNQLLSAATLQPAGTGTMGHENRMPYLALNWIICVQGIFPSRG